jgi:hypothetical protein
MSCLLSSFSQIARLLTHQLISFLYNISLTQTEQEEEEREGLL